MVGGEGLMIVGVYGGGVCDCGCLCGVFVYECSSCEVGGKFVMFVVTEFIPR